MKKLLAMMKSKPGETPERFAQRVQQSLKERGLLDEQGKLKDSQKEYEEWLRRVFGLK